MPNELSPRKLQKAVENGFKRLENFRAARLLHLRQYVGQYYDQSHGLVGSEPLNLMFNAIRVLVPNIVSNFPKNKVTSRYLAYRDYSELLGLALMQNDKELNIRDIYRCALVDSFFAGIGIAKTGMCDSGTVLALDGDDQVDPGQIYTSNVDFDNWVMAPDARRIEESLFAGDKIKCVSRLALLESGLYDNAQIEKLPKSSYSDGEETADQMSMRSLSPGDKEYDDEVDICELWVPRAQAIVTIPGSCDYISDDFLRVAESNCVDEGPYTYLKITPPVPNNPIPVPLTGIWHDLHVMANRMAKKIMEQADRQKDVIGYKRNAADDAQEALDAEDGEAIAMDDPDGVKVHSFGGQQRSNEVHVQQLEVWFNMMAGNPQGVGGVDSKAGSATEATILQGNANIGLEDMKDCVYIFGAAESRKRAWFMHTDPLIEVPLTRRVSGQAMMVPGPMGTPIMQPAQPQEVQVFLTPEARRGEFIDFTFEFEPESMGRVDSKTRLAQALEFGVKLIPAAATAAQTCLMMGIPFSFTRYITKMAKLSGMDWMEEVFQDPEVQMQMAMQMARGPQEEGSKGKGAPAPGGGAAGIMQNGQPPGVGATMNPAQQFNSDAQMGAAEAQGDLAVRPTY